MAVDELKQIDYGSSFNIKIITDVCDCSGITAPVNAMENIYGKRNHSVTFQSVFGPMCDYSLAPVARYASFWNVSVITVSALAQEFRKNKFNEYKTLTNVGPTMYSLDRFIVNLFNYFNWKHVILFFDKDFQEHETNFNCFLTMASLKAALLNSNVVVDYKIRDKQDRRSFEKILEDFVGNKFSIILLCGHPDFVLETMLAAKNLGFINGEYAFINIDTYAHLHNRNRLYKPWLLSRQNQTTIDYTKSAYESLLTVTLKFDSQFEKFEQFKKKLTGYASNVFKNESEVNFFVASFYDAMYVYINALNKTVMNGGGVNDISKVLSNIWDKQFEGITGKIVIDRFGERMSEFVLHDLNPETEEFEPVIYSSIFNRTETVLIYDVKKRPIYWYKYETGDLPDSPKCGYNRAKCPVKEPLAPWVWIAISMGILMLIMLIISLILYRKLKFEAELKAMNWLIKWEDIRSELLPLNGSAIRNDSYADDEIDQGIVEKKNFESLQNSKTIMYKRNLCYLKKISKPKIEITRALLLEAKKIKDLQHDHIVRFIGLCIASNHQFIFTEYCQKGSLQDILENQEIELDVHFKYHLIHDIIKGMLFIHSSDLKSHGNLTSTNCVVDSRFTLKITDFGFPMLRSKHFDTDENFYKKQLWRAPELHYSFYQNSVPLQMICGTQKGDVYSFAIIIQEIFYRNGVFYLSDKEKETWFSNEEKDIQDVKVTNKEIFDNVKHGLRPSIEEGFCSKDICELVKRCWSENPNDRPDFGLIRDNMRKITKISGNILDNLLARMEQYANNLEDIVKARTEECENEKKRAEALLYRLLPLSVATVLMQGQKVTAETFRSVTIYFSDICGFTKLSSESTPMQVVNLLNELYTTFDSIIESFDVYKVETIGDAYMVVSGLPQRNENHAREIARMSLALLTNVFTFKIPHKPNQQLLLRIGIHSGPCVAGVVGLKMPRYCLFGDTVNTASRMESNGEPLKIHVSPQTKDALDKFGTFDLQLRGPVEMKGKGSITTYWLLGEKDGYKIDMNQQKVKDQ